MKVTTIGIITGGTHAQASVNIDHANDIARALRSADYSIKLYDLSKEKEFDALISDRRAGNLDIVFNNAAGKQGGDGTVEGLLELLEIPFVGSDTLATAVAFDKKTTKALVKAAGVPVAKGLVIHREQFLNEPEDVMEKLAKRVKVPMIIKASQGSDSIGVSLVKTDKEIVPAIRRALKEDDTILVENFVRRKAEVTCMVIGSREDAFALDPVERVYETDILYSDSKRTYRFPVIKDEINELVKKYALKAHRVLGCSDYSRSDFIIGRKGGVFFLELNAHAGLGDSGPTAFSTKNSIGWSYEQMIQQILKSALKRQGK